MDRWSNTKVTEDDIRALTSARKLALIITDQQFDYWYDPCGKSGHELNPYLTGRSQIALRRLRDACELQVVDKSSLAAKTIQRSNSLPFLISAFSATCPSAGSMTGLARCAITRIKNYLWHGEKVEHGVLDEIVQALEEAAEQ